MKSQMPPEYVEKSGKAFRAVMTEIKKAVKGKDQIIETALLAILARGHILLEDIPGVGKTTLALAFSRAMQLQYNRVQFTPDVMPSDVTGYSVYRKSSDSFEFVPGAAMCNLLLADEINRTSSKTQAALLQVMEEGKVTVDLKTFDTPQPFTVIATQNPVGYAGTQLLPESQLDRFLVRLSMGYPDERSELEILRSKSSSNVLDSISPVLDTDDIRALQKIAAQLHVHDEIYEYLVSLCGQTRRHPLIELGASPRGTIALLRMSRAHALIQGRDYVLSSDVRAVMEPCIAHRLILKARAKAAGVTAVSLVKEILDAVPAPKIG